jgi:hypothetical protein
VNDVNKSGGETRAPSGKASADHPTGRAPRNLRRTLYDGRVRVVVMLDQFVSWPPIIQIPLIVLLTILVIMSWGLLWSSYAATTTNEGIWQALTHFMDGGTMASDRGRIVRLLGTGVTTTGVLVLSFLTGAFASKLGERIDDLRSGRSPVIQRDHIVILGFDAKVPLIVRELARSHQRMNVVILAQEEKNRLEALVRFARHLSGSRVRVTCRTGDPRIELALLRVCADRARAIVVVPPSKLDDDHALRWSVSTLLACRRAVGPRFSGRIVVESRRAAHGELLALTGEAGVAGTTALPIAVFASDDIVARILAQSIRQNGIYFALRELLSFKGCELYLEPVPSTLVGKSFDDAHAAISNGIAVGVMRGSERHRMSPPYGNTVKLDEHDRLIVLQNDKGSFKLGGKLGPIDGAHAASPPQPLVLAEAQTILLVGANRTLPRLICELDRILASGSKIQVSCPKLEALERSIVALAASQCKSITVEQIDRDPMALGFGDDPRLYSAEGVVILGCEDEEDPDGDASALALLLHLRHTMRAKGISVKRLVTEVRDPTAAQQISAMAHDFLVSNDVVAMVLAQATVEPELASVYRELLDPTGVEVFLVPRTMYAPTGDVTFGEVMTAARRRGEIAIGFYPYMRDPVMECPRAQIEMGDREVDEVNPVYLNPPRDHLIPEGPEASIVVLADPPDGASWQ